ncbi:protoporphyrinogen oxidase HemJ [Roseicella aquatilis]|uniref:Protoporphyrinogen IX oxidase n=1 Tax=Roseicella aquatilis TaxID=2527868 RepID=A0A4R4DRQ2_9PROT|nr:protoporphyrinogen oxidase HemJ [Roseicella aquatilis]TCZ64058.1 protoporphyrinogen oxidase HemJ [Roseicella aquatilis]
MTFDALAPFYPWVKALHLISVIAWMAGLFYLPRLFVYHSQVPPGSEQDALFKVMERRLIRAIMNPAMIAVWIFGITLVLTPGVVDWTAGWWHVKLTSVLGMTWFHHHLSLGRKAMERGERPRTERYWRAMNEVPTVLMIAIVIMVIVKPF